MSVAAAPGGFTSVGQAPARRAVLAAAEQGRLQRTLLVHGPAGSGKGAFVDDLLALVFCEQADVAARPCNACRGCRTARERAHPDLVLGSVERWREMRSTGESIVAAARRWLLETSGAPIASERRVIVIEGIDLAGEQVQNALLKALEEPAPRQMFILVADEPSHVLPTIRSRSQALRIGPVPNAELVEWLMDVQRLPRDQAVAVSRIADGMTGRAAALVTTTGLLDWRRRTQAELLGLLERGRADRFSSARELLDEAARIAGAGGDAREAALAAAVEQEASTATGPVPSQQRAAAMLVIDAWIGLTRDLLVATAGRAELGPSIALLDAAASAAVRIGPDRLVGFLGVLEEVREALRQNAAPRLAMERLMLAWPALGSA